MTALSLVPHLLLPRLLEAAIQSAQPALCIPPYLPALHDRVTQAGGRLVVVGAGKASAAMAKAVEDHWPGDLSQMSGVVVTRYGHAVPCQRIQVLEAAHPVPDAAGLAGAEQVLQTVQGLTPADTVLCLISGGGSALWPLPLPGISLQDKQDLARQLLQSGADIVEMNCVRRHLSAIKGGRLAAACYPAQVVTLMISDVAGDSLVDIASGPTVADATTCEQALAIVRRYGIVVPPAVQAHLQSGSGETLKPEHPVFANVSNHLIATPQMALEAAAKVAREAGWQVHILGDAIEGEAKDVGKALAGLALQVAGRQQPFSAPCVLLSGGETTVTMVAQPPSQRSTPAWGGRNVEFLLALGAALKGHPAISALAADTDGIDGAIEVAGAMWHPDSLARAQAQGLNLQDYLSRHDAHRFFQALGDSVVTGPTHTNVNDFRAIVVGNTEPT
jgi:glycerate 2-kinase